MSTRLKNGTTAKENMGETRMKSGVLFIEVQLNVQKQFEFEIFGFHTIGNRWQQSTFTDGGL